jgi:hypothetical protein
MPGSVTKQSWPAGRRPDDPAPGDPWYRKVQETTGFVSGTGPWPEVPPQYRDILETCSEHYHRLYPDRLRIAE